MFDPQKILQQVLGSNNDLGDQDNRKSGISTDTLTGAAFGGFAALLLGSDAGRQLGGSALKLGGVAALGGRAYKAWQNWQAQRGGQASAHQENMEDATAKAEGTTF